MTRPVKLLIPAVIAAALVIAGCGGSIAARRRRKTGTTMSYTDSQAATTAFTLRKPQPGIKDKRRGCIKPRTGQRVRPSQRCTRYVALGSFTHRHRAGANKVPLHRRARHKQERPHPQPQVPHHPLVRQAAKRRTERRFSSHRPAPARRALR